jgi:glucose-1-phosphate thymidylyltransferase
MKVIIPLAGFGTRLRPHTYTKPKPLVNVAGKPVLGHILDKLDGLDIEDLIFIVGYLGEHIKDYVERNYHFHTRYVEQKELKGQAHAIWLAKEHIQGPVLIIFVDTIFKADLKALARLDSDGAIYVKEVVDPRRFGVVTLEDGYISRFVEKPSSPISNLAVIGVYYLRDSVALFAAIDELLEKQIQTEDEYFLADALQIMVNRGARLEAWPVDVWEDCGTPDSLLDTNRFMLDNGHDNSDSIEFEDSLIVPPVHIDPSATVVNSIVGPYVTIAQGCEVRNSIIRGSIIDEEAYIANTMFSQSLIGQKARVYGRYRKLNVGDSSVVDFSERE